MNIDGKIYEMYAEKAASVSIKELTIGLGYTAVVLEDGSAGLAYTWLDRKTGCSVIKSTDETEGKPALQLLEKIMSGNPIERTLAVATVNALNKKSADGFPTDNGSLLEDLNISEGKKVAMVGYFGPVAERIRKTGEELLVYDLGKGEGESKSFFSFLESEADALILTSTSLLNGSTEEVLSFTEKRAVPSALLGPTTIMEPEIYRGLPVKILAGMVVKDADGAVRAVRNGKGTPAIQKYCRKVYLADLGKL